jgi:hypothetical protein
VSTAIESASPASAASLSSPAGRGPPRGPARVPPRGPGAAAGAGTAAGLSSPTTSLPSVLPPPTVSAVPMATAAEVTVSPGSSVSSPSPAGRAPPRGPARGPPRGPAAAAAVLSDPRFDPRFGGGMGQSLASSAASDADAFEAPDKYVDLLGVSDKKEADRVRVRAVLCGCLPLVHRGPCVWVRVCAADGMVRPAHVSHKHHRRREDVQVTGLVCEGASECGALMCLVRVML